VKRKDEQFGSRVAPDGTGAPLDASAEHVQVSRERTISSLRLLWNNRRLLVRVLFWSALVSSLLSLFIHNRYQAVTQLMPPDNQSGAGMALLSAANRLGNLGAIAGDLLGMGGVKSSGALFVGVLQSRTVRDRLIDKFQLQKTYRTSKIEDTRDELAANTIIGEDRKSGIITITVTDKDPQRATEMAQAYITELDQLVAQVSTSSARRERVFLEERLTAVKQDLDGAAKRFSDFASKNTAIDIPAQGKAMVEAAARLQGELIAAESELRGLEAIYTDQNARVRALRARAAELHSQLEKLGGNANGSPATPGEFASNYPSIRQLPVLGVTYADLYRQTKIEEAVFELLTQQYELAKVQEAKEIPSVKVLDVAVVPTKKVYPHRLLIVLTAMSFCFFFACAWLLGRDLWRGIVPEDPGKRFVQEVIQSVRSDFWRLAPEGSFLRRTFLRVGLREPVQVVAPDLEGELPEETTELARVARNNMR
jgi:capsule polysaccharide export protein KpsE/RkpR